jgi:CelD/BcsL family acetyltransferase involved in cellulose biosynthesis
MDWILRLVLLEQIPADSNLRQQWNALVHGVARPQVFYTYEWALAVQRAYQATLQPLLFLAYDDLGSLCGIAALSTRIGERRASFLCSTTGDYCDFLSSSECKPAFVGAVLAELRKQGIGEVTLTNLPADSDTVEALRAESKSNGYYCFMRRAYVCVQVALKKLERRPGENKPVLPGKKMVRRSLSAMGREGPVRLEHARTWDEVVRVLPEFVQAHVTRFLATGRISNNAHAERRHFLHELAKLLAEPGWLVLTRMMSGARPLAWNYGFQFAGAWFWYQPTFDSDLEKLSPGFCLLSKLIEEAVEHPQLSTVDLGLGAEEYKDRFANQARETLCISLRTSAAQHVREIARYRVAEVIRKYPRAEAVVRAGVAHFLKLKRDGVVRALQLLMKRASALLWSETEIVFLEWKGAVSSGSGMARLETLNLNHLASAAAQKVNNEATLRYLLRSALRLRERRAEAFGWIDPDGTLLRCVWVSPFEGFILPELNARVESPSPDCVMLFDHWTSDNLTGPLNILGMVAERMRDQGKHAWTYSLACDVSSVRSLEKDGFQLRYSLTRRRILGSQTIRGETPKFDRRLAPEVSASV